MSKQVLQAEVDSRHIFVRMNRFLVESGLKTCGLILAQCNLKTEQLDRLKEAVSVQEPNLEAQYLYDHNVLAIFLLDKPLSYTHYVSLSVKQFLQEGKLLEGSLLITCFKEYEFPKEADVKEMLRMLQEEENDENTILIFNQPEKHKKSTILIIDEDETVGELLDSRLLMKGYEVYKANSGLEGLRLFDEVNPDLVITELSLPVYDGYEVIRGIRNRIYSDYNIMVLSNKRMERDISTCFE